MSEDRINYIRKLMDNLKVVSYDEHDVMCSSSFIRIKTGNYKLNNNEVIRREGVTKCSGNMNAVVIFAVTKENRILIVIQPRVALCTEEKVAIEMPGGYIDDDEDIFEAAKRELAEETGYDSDNLNIIDSYYSDLGYCGEKISIVLALDCEKKYNQDLDDDEFINYVDVTENELLFLINNGYILDATTKLTYYEVVDYLKKNNRFMEVFNAKKEEKEKN